MPHFTPDLGRPGETPEPGRPSQMADRERRKQFRRDINRAPKQGESIDGTSCLTMLLFPALLMFALVYGLGLFGLAVLLP